MNAILQTHGIKHALSCVGSNSKYQIKVVLILAWQYLFRSFYLIYYAYLTQPPVFKCQDPNNPDEFYDCYENNGGCDLKIESQNIPDSLVNELKFYCEDSYIRTLGGSLFFVGGNVGVIFFSYISDRYGRKIAIQYSYLIGSIALFLLGVATTGPFTYILFLMLIWAGMSCYMFLSLIYLAEVSDEHFSRNASAVLLLSITGAQIIIITISYFIPYWKTVFIWFIAIPALLTNISFFFLDETPIYLESKKDIAQTLMVLEKIGQTNKKSIEDQELETCVPQTLIPVKEIEPAVPGKSYNYIEIILHPQLRRRVYIYSLIRLYLCWAYWGCIFTLSSMGGSLYINSMVAAIAEALGYVLSFKAYLFPTRKLLKGSLQVVMIMGFSFLLIPKDDASDGFLGPIFFQSILSLIMRTSVCFIYGFIYSLGNELFPTEVRSQSNGVAGIFSDLGGVVSPLLPVLAQSYNLHPLFLLGVLGVAPLIASQYLPEEKLTSLDEFSLKTFEMKKISDKSKDYKKMSN